MPPAGNVVDGLAFECFLVAVRAQINVMTKEVKKKKKKKIEGTENIRHFGPVIFELPLMKFWRHVKLAIFRTF